MSARRPLSPVAAIIHRALRGMPGIRILRHLAERGETIEPAQFEAVIARLRDAAPDLLSPPWREPVEPRFRDSKPTDGEVVQLVVRLLRRGAP